MSTNEPASTQRDGSSEQSIEELRRRYQGLHTKKTQAETLRDEAKKRLDELKAQAREKYGTDDAAELQKKLDEMVVENARKVAEYKAHLDSIDQGLAEVERKFGASAPQSTSFNSGQSRR
jgi:predicted transcriptional regulator